MFIIYLFIVFIIYCLSPPCDNVNSTRAKIFVHFITVSPMLRIVPGTKQAFNKYLLQEGKEEKEREREQVFCPLDSWPLEYLHQVDTTNFTDKSLNKLKIRQTLDYQGLSNTCSSSPLLWVLFLR